MKIEFDEQLIPKLLTFTKLRTCATNVISHLLYSKQKECWNPIHPPTLCSFALQHSSRRKILCLDEQMKSFIQHLGERSSCYLKCWWAPIPFLPIRETNIFTMNNLIGWKESTSFGNSIQLHEAHLPAMESLSCNIYMQKGDYYAVHLKQIECGFWKDVGSYL